MNLAHYFTPFSFFPEQSSSHQYGLPARLIAVYPPPPLIRTSEDVALEKQLARVPIESLRVRLLTADALHDLLRKNRFSRDRAITLDAVKAYAKRCIDALVGVDAESRRRDEKARGLRVLFVAKSAEYTKGLFFFYPLRHGLPEVLDLVGYRDALFSLQRATRDFYATDLTEYANKAYSLAHRAAGQVHAGGSPAALVLGLADRLGSTRCTKAEMAKLVEATTTINEISRRILFIPPPAVRQSIGSGLVRRRQRGAAAARRRQGGGPGAPRGGVVRAGRPGVAPQAVLVGPRAG